MTDSQPDFRGAFTTGGAPVIPDTRVYDDLLKGAASLFREMVSGNPNYASLDGAAANWLEVYGATFGRDEGGRLPVGRTVPVDVDRFDGPQHARRSEQELLVSLCQLNEEVLAELKRLNARAGSAKEDRTSVKIETGAKRELKATTHLYAGDTDQAENTWLVEEAIRIHQLTQAYCDEGAA